MSKTLTRDELQAEAAALAERQAGILTELNRQQTERFQRDAQAQREFDERMVAGYSRRALDQSVDDAHQTLEQQLESDPMVTALADFLYALLHRNRSIHEHLSALSRLGRDAGQAPLLPSEIGRLDDLLLPVVRRLAYARADAEFADLHQRRDNAATNPEEK